MNAPGPGHNSSPAVFKGTFADFSIVKTRKLARFVVEVPIEEADAALEAMGGLPRSDMERWVAVALLNPNPEGGDAKSAIRHASTTRTQDSNAAPVATGRDGRGERPKPWGSLPSAKQAGIRCADPAFQEWLKGFRPALATAAHETHPDDPAEAAAVMVRTICNVRSRSMLDDKDHTRKAWQAMDTEFLIATHQLPEPR